MNLFVFLLIWFSDAFKISAISNNTHTHRISKKEPGIRSVVGYGWSLLYTFCDGNWCVGGRLSFELKVILLIVQYSVIRVLEFAAKSDQNTTLKKLRKRRHTFGQLKVLRTWRGETFFGLHFFKDFQFLPTIESTTYLVRH